MSYCIHANRHVFRFIFRITFLVVMLLCGAQALVGQRTLYIMHATLDTQYHYLTGHVSIHYTNHTSRVLDSLGIHLWPNAYQTNHSALVRQMLRNGNTTLYWAEEKDRGGLSGLQFKSIAHPLTFSSDPVHPDIGWLQLQDPLAPGDSLVITTPFTLKIPPSVSRLGYTSDGAYQITQWYPRIAVADENGWHMMPYLDHGEFYNAFADYRVHLTIPSSLTLASTGVVKNINVADRMTTWVLTADNVIDFAWFASPTLQLQKGTVDVGSARPVSLLVYSDVLSKKEWHRAYTYAERALKFYSEWLGPYPYPQMTVVSTPLSAAGYMEYPMLAQIAYTSDTALLDIAIAHEIGHTWLYGILANNERAHPWMDEGLNTFLEQEYTSVYQPRYKDQYLPLVLSRKRSMPQTDAMQHVMRFNGELQPPARDPEWQNQNQYYFSAYHLPAQGLAVMKGLLGAEKVKTMFRTYFNQHHFSHVSPADMQASFESACECNLDWFFTTWISQSHDIDYRIIRLQKQDKEVTIENYSGVVAPLQLWGYNKGQVVLRHWVHGFRGKKIFHLDRPVDQISLYEELGMVNTRWRRHRWPRPFFPRIHLLPSIAAYDRGQISMTPVAAYTTTDGGLVGLAVTSGLFPQRNLKLFLAPLYGLESRSFRGMGELRYIGNIRRSIFDKFLMTVSGRHFGYFFDPHYQFRDDFTRLSAGMGLRIRPAGSMPRALQWWQYRYVDVTQRFSQGISYEDRLYADTSRRYGVHELSWQWRKNDALRPLEFMAAAQAGKGFVRLNARYKQHFKGRHPRSGIWTHGYAGWLPYYRRPEAYVPFTMNGSSSSGFYSIDYMYDEWLIGRNAEKGLASHQVFERDAHLKTLSIIGLGDDWMLGGGISVALPFKMIHAYMDAAVYPSLIKGKTTLTYSGGLSLVAIKDVFEIYLPILESKDIRESVTYIERDRWFERISFQANFKFFQPLDFIDRQQLGL